MDYYFKFTYCGRIYKYKISGKLNINKVNLGTRFIIDKIGVLLLNTYSIFQNETILHCTMTAYDDDFVFNHKLRERLLYGKQTTNI